MLIWEETREGHGAAHLWWARAGSSSSFLLSAGSTSNWQRSVHGRPAYKDNTRFRGPAVMDTSMINEGQVGYAGRADGYRPGQGHAAPHAQTQVQARSPHARAGPRLQGDMWVRMRLMKAFRSPACGLPAQRNARGDRDSFCFIFFTRVFLASSFFFQEICLVLFFQSYIIYMTASLHWPLCISATTLANVTRYSG